MLDVFCLLLRVIVLLLEQTVSRHWLLFVSLGRLVSFSNSLLLLRRSLKHVLQGYNVLNAYIILCTISKQISAWKQALITLTSADITIERDCHGCITGQFVLLPQKIAHNFLASPWSLCHRPTCISAYTLIAQMVLGRRAMMVHDHLLVLMLICAFCHDVALLMVISRTIIVFD